MEEYLKKLINMIPKESKGYNYITNVKIDIPILCCSINAIKRKELGLQLAEEIIMKLLDNDVTTVCDICSIMGLEENVVNIIIGNLSVKNFVIVTAGNCILMSKGKEVLKNLKEIKLESENISPVYINLITEEIYTDKYNNQRDKRGKVDNVLMGKIKVDTEYINKRFSEIRDIFNDQQKIFGGSNLSQIQLYKIENIEQDKVQYLNVSCNIYKSKSGEEIEICSDKDVIIEQIQSDILEQIIKGKKLKYTFKDSSRYKNISDNELEKKRNYNNEDIKNLISKFNKVGKDDKQKVVDEFYKIYRNERALIENELELMIEDLSENTKEIRLYTNRLSDIIFDSEYMNPICKAIKKGTKVSISYNFERDIKKSKQNAERTYPEIKHIKLIEDPIRFNDIIINFDNKVKIETSYYDIKVLDGKYVTKTISHIKHIGI